jgi:hypothetical protein
MASFPGSTADNVELARLDGTRPFTADVAMGTHKITGLQDAVSADHAVNKGQLDAAVAGALSTVADWKQSVRVATTANITLSGAQTIDGVSVIAGDRVLVKNQSTGSQNGIYVAASGAWTRATDADASAEVTTGLTVVVEEGTVAGGHPYILTTANPITLGTTALVFTQISTVPPDAVSLEISGGSIRRAALTGDITAAAGSNTTAIAAGVIVDTDINASAAIAITKLENLAANSLLGRAANTIGAMAAITAASNGQVLRMASGALGFGAIDLSSASSIQGVLPLINLTGGSAIGQVLRYAAGNVPAWGALDLADTDAVINLLPLANVTGGSAVGQVLRNTAGNVPAWGALDLADTDAVINRLPLGNFANGTTGRVLVAGASDPAYGTALGNTSDAFTVTGNSLALSTSTTYALQVDGGVVLSAALVGGARLLGLLGNVTTTQMPSNTGDQVAFLAQAAALWSTGIPVGGFAIGADSTGLYVKGPDGTVTKLAAA